MLWGWRRDRRADWRKGRGRVGWTTPLLAWVGFGCGGVGLGRALWRMVGGRGVMGWDKHRTMAVNRKPHRPYGYEKKWDRALIVGLGADRAMRREPADLHRRLRSGNCLVSEFRKCSGVFTGPRARRGTVTTACDGLGELGLAIGRRQATK